MKRSHRLLAAGTLCVFALEVALASARAAEVTVEDLTGNAVSGVGPYYQDVNEAIRAFSRADFARALSHLQKAKEATPMLAPPEVMMARLHLAAGQTAAGNGMLERAIKSAPDDPEAYVMLLERALADGRLTEAEMLFPHAEKALDGFDQNPRRKKDLIERGYSVGAAVDESQQDLAGAKAKLEKLLQLEPTSAGAHQRLGRVLFAMGDAESQKKAFEEFKQAAELDKEAISAGLMMAMLYQDPAKSEQWVKFALKNNPDDARTLRGAANFYFRANKGEEARQYAEQAVKLTPKVFESNLIAGLAAQMEGDFAAAVEYFSQAHLLQPANPSVMNNLAQSLVELPDDASRSRAREFAEINAKQYPNNADLLATLGWVNFRLRRMAEAEQAFNAALRASGGTTAMRAVSPDTSYYFAQLAASQGRKDDAVGVLRQMVESKQPFVYRKMAEKLLAQLGGAAGGGSSAPSGQTPTRDATP